MSEILVAIIDEDPTYVQVLNRVLLRAGFRTIIWTPGTDAFSLIQAAKPQLVVLDIHLGVHLGESVIEQLKAEPAMPDTAVLLCSSWAWLLQEQLLELYPRRAAILEKPFDLGDFLVVARRLTCLAVRSLEPYYQFAPA